MTARRDPGVAATRGLAILGVIAAHAALSYLDTPIGWAVRDSSRWLGADAAVWIARQFLMPTFFLVGGMAAAGLLAVHGPRGYLRHRALRLGVPFAIALVPVSIAINALWDRGRALDGRAAVARAVPQLRGSELPITLAHLWFLYYLLWLSALALIVALALRGRTLATLDRAIAAIAARPWSQLVVLPLPAALCLAGGGKLQLDTPLGFAIDPINLVYFGSFFAWGWLVAARPSALPAMARGAPLYLVAAAALIAAVVPTLLTLRDHVDLPPPLTATAAAAIGSWALVLALIGGCQRWLAAPPRFLIRLADASLWIYVAHFPIVIALQLVTSQLVGPGPVEYVAIVTVALAVSLGVASVSRTSRPSRHE